MSGLAGEHSVPGPRRPLTGAWLARLTAAAVGGLLLLSGCYTPQRFTAGIVINRTGDWTLKYDGTLASAALVPGLMPDRPTPTQFAERVRNITNDMRRDPGFRDVEYLGDGRYRVAYERSGNIYSQPGITFIRTDSRILSISYIKTENEIWVRGSSAPSAQRRWVTDASLDIQGDLRVTTDAEVIDHNATETRDGPNGTKIYLWRIRGVDAPAPRLVIPG